jgi:hypothetical protein
LFAKARSLKGDAWISWRTAGVVRAFLCSWMRIVSDLKRMN